METTGLIEIISSGEGSKCRFKTGLSNNRQLAEDFIAFSNFYGGILLVGIDNFGTVMGITRDDVRIYNNLIADTAANFVCPPINIEVENKILSDKLIMVVTIPDGISKPYMDNNAAIWIKNGSDKRKVTSREEIQRMFQAAGLLHGDEIPANGLSVSDIDLPFFEDFFQKEYNETLDSQDNSITNIFET
jgi:ATP-dependent DNA helicase RecG